MTPASNVIDVTRIVWWDRFLIRRIGDVTLLGWLFLAVPATSSHLVSTGDWSQPRLVMVAVSAMTLAFWVAAVTTRLLAPFRKRLSLSVLVSGLIFYNAVALAATFVPARVFGSAAIITLILTGASAVIGLRRRWLLRIATPVDATARATPGQR